MSELRANLNRIFGYLVLLMCLSPSSNALNPGEGLSRIGSTRALAVDTNLSNGAMEILYVDALQLLTRFFRSELEAESSELSDAQIVLRSALSQKVFDSSFRNSTIRDGISRLHKVNDLKSEFLRIQKDSEKSRLAGIEGHSLDAFLLYFRMWVQVHQFGWESESGELANEARYFLVRINTFLEGSKVGTAEQKKAYLDQLLVFAARSVLPSGGVTDANFERIRTSVIEFVHSLENPGMMGLILKEADRRESRRSKAAMTWGAIVGGVGFNFVRLVLSFISPESHGFMSSFEAPLGVQGTVTAVCAVAGGLVGALAQRAFGTEILCTDLTRFTGADDACLKALGGGG